MKAKRVSPPKQLNIRLPDETHRKLKAQCAIDGRSLADVVGVMIAAYLAGRIKIADLPALK